MDPPGTALGWHLILGGVAGGSFLGVLAIAVNAGRQQKRWGQAQFASAASGDVRPGRGIQYGFCAAAPGCCRRAAVEYGLYP
jgi:hypothetical protein